MHLVLVHGLGRTPLSLVGLARYLRKQGHTTEIFGYLAAAESFEKIQRRLHDRLGRVASTATTYAVVGHSLGGLLLRAALPGVYPAPRHLVMLGTPNNPPRLARRVAGFRPFQFLSGDCGRCLTNHDFFSTLPPPAVAYTIIAGTAGPLVPFGNEHNDWVVSVSETMVAETDRPILVHTAHSFMMNNVAVRNAVSCALADGDDG